MKSTFARAAASVVLALASLLDAPAPARAQETQENPACTYDTCALRIEHGAWFSGQNLVRGAAGERVGPIVPFSSTLSHAVAGTDSAMVYAALFHTKYTWGSSMALAGTIVGSIPLVISNDDFSKYDISFMIASYGVALVGGWMIQSGWRDLSRSVWWYNRQFAE